MVGLTLFTCRFKCLTKDIKVLRVVQLTIYIILLKLKWTRKVRALRVKQIGTVIISLLHNDVEVTIHFSRILQCIKSSFYILL